MENKIFLDMLYKKYQSALLSKIQAARELNISRATLDRLRNDGEIKSQKLGKGIRFNIHEIARIVLSKS
jgi:excisionase family DNA binding protein